MDVGAIKPVSNCPRHMHDQLHDPQGGILQFTFPCHGRTDPNKSISISAMPSTAFCAPPGVILMQIRDATTIGQEKAAFHPTTMQRPVAPNSTCTKCQTYAGNAKRAFVRDLSWLLRRLGVSE